MTVCSGCGECCLAIPLPVTKDDVRRKLAGEIDARTRRWILDELEVIPPKEARRIAPWREDEALQMTPDGWSAEYPTYYRCSNLDEETGLCTSHDDLPPTCSGYPYYGTGKVLPGMHLPPRCAFRADQGLPVEEWQPVPLGRKS